MSNTNQLAALMRIIAYSMTAVLLLHDAATAQERSVADGSLVIVEMESVADLNGWAVGSTTDSGRIVSYVHWTGGDFFDVPGKQVLEYTVSIREPGRYRFIWHSKVGRGDSKTEHNDTWLRIPGAADFYGDKNGHIVHPKGTCTNDCPNGAGADGWFKIYSSGTTNWTWSTRTSDRDAHLIYAVFDTPAMYAIQISARSNGHFLDRFILYKESEYSQDDVTNSSRSSGWPTH